MYGFSEIAGIRSWENLELLVLLICVFLLVSGLRCFWLREEMTLLAHIGIASFAPSFLSSGARQYRCL